MSAKIFLNDIKKIGRVLKMIRESKKLTQSKVASMAGVNEKHLRDLEKGRYSAGIDLIFLICRALNANRILVFSLALEEDYLEFINNADKMLTEYEALTNDEVGANANNGKSLRHDSEKAEKNFTKRLLGGDKCAIIYKKMKGEQTSLFYTKVVMKAWKNSKFWDAG